MYTDYSPKSISEILRGALKDTGDAYRVRDFWCFQEQNCLHPGRPKLLHRTSNLGDGGSRGGSGQKHGIDAL